MKIFRLVWVVFCLAGVIGCGDGSGGGGNPAANLSKDFQLLSATQNADGSVDITFNDVPRWAGQPVWNQIVGQGLEAWVMDSRCLAPEKIQLTVDEVGEKLVGTFGPIAVGENILMKVRFVDPADQSEIAPWLDQEDPGLNPWIFKENGATYITAVFGDAGFVPGEKSFERADIFRESLGALEVKTYIASLGIEDSSAEYFLKTANLNGWSSEDELFINQISPWLKLQDSLIQGPTIVYIKAVLDDEMIWADTRGFFREGNPWALKFIRDDREEYVFCVVMDELGNIRPAETGDVPDLKNIVPSIVSVEFSE